MNKPWIQLYNGKAFYPWNPKKEDFDLETIARSLSRIPRFLGHTTEFYSVAQHSVDCLMDWYGKPVSGNGVIVAPNDIAKAILFHDAHEAYAFGDIPSPVKRELNYSQGYESNLLDDLSGRIDQQIAYWLGIERHYFYSGSVVLADMIALATEKRDLMPGGPEWEIELPEAREKKIWCMNSEAAYQQFIDLANELGIK